MQVMQDTGWAPAAGATWRTVVAATHPTAVRRGFEKSRAVGCGLYEALEHVGRCTGVREL